MCNKSKIDNTIDGLGQFDNENSTILRVKLNNARQLFVQTNEFESCYSKFFLKEGNSTKSSWRRLVYFFLFT